LGEHYSQPLPDLLDLALRAFGVGHLFAQSIGQIVSGESIQDVVAAIDPVFSGDLPSKFRSSKPAYD
jgi:hypothetical protein